MFFIRGQIFQRLFIVILVFVFSLQTVHAKEYNLKNIREHFSDVLLVIYFNHPFYQNIEFENELYASVFKNIVYYGDRLELKIEADALHDLGFINNDGNHGGFNVVYTRQGYYYARLIKKVLEDHPGYKGYLIMQDDVLLQFWHFLDLDQDKIWYGATKFKDGAENIVYYSDQENPTSWFASNIGYSELKKMIPYLTPSEMEMLENNFGKNGYGMSYCDCFYIPGRLAKRVESLCEPLRRTWCDLFVTNVLGCLDSVENWERLPYLWTCFDPTGAHVQQYYEPYYFWLHSLKYSDPSTREYVRNIFKERFYNNLDEDSLKCLD